MPDFSTVLMIVAVGMLAWDCLEVGKNDAANLINGVFGARVMTHRAAVWLAGLAVLAGAMFSSPVIETARTGIFEPGHLQLHQAMVVYVSVYIVDTALLHAYSAYGMPVSTTASLIFELVGAAIGVSLSLGLVHWDKVGSVLNAILVSVLLTGIAGFLVQRVFRAAIHDEHTDHLRVLLHGLSGRIVSQGQTFVGAMPAQASHATASSACPARCPDASSKSPGSTQGSMPCSTSASR